MVHSGELYRTRAPLSVQRPMLALRCDLSLLHIFPALDDACHARPSDLTGID